MQNSVPSEDRPSGATASLPEQPPIGPSHWLGSDLNPDRWTRELDSRQLHELLELAAELDLDDPSTLGGPAVLETRSGPLGTLARELRADLLDGLGFVVLRGLPVEELDHRTTAAAYLALGRVIGGLRSQNAQGHLLGHVRNLGADFDDPTTRIYQTNRRQTFHTDSCDVVGLLCLQPAKEGGESLVVSAQAVYRLLEQQRPDLATRLFEPIATDRRGEIPTGGLPWFEIPVLTWFDQQLTALYQRQYVDSASRFEAAPRPDAGLIEALDLFDEIMNDPAVHLALDFAPGDMQFVNNHALLHDRTGFIDDPDRPRHLLRLWLTLPEARKLPSVFTQRYGSVTVGDRGGILTADTALSVPI